MKKQRKNNKQLVHKKSVTSYISLPKLLVDSIGGLKLTKTDKSHCFKFIGILLRDSLEEFGNLISFVPKPQTYLIKTFDNSYYKWLNVLIIEKVVIRNNYYSHEEGVCYQYQVSPSFFLEEPTLNILCNYNYLEPLVTLGYKDIIKGVNKEHNLHNNWFEEDVSTLVIDYGKLMNLVRNRIGNLSIEDFQVDEQIKEHAIKLYSTNGKSFYVKTTDAIAKAKKQCKSLIKDDGRCGLAEPKNFLHNKKQSIGYSYLNSLVRLQRKDFKAERNPTNKRLDTNFTNMSSLLVDEICLQNDLVQIDLSNSQFAILSNVLKERLHSDDFEQFKELSVSGQLYAYIQRIIGLESVADAKNAMFEIMFSSRRNNTTSKAKLKKLFPSVIGWIDRYKKAHGDNQFSIMLQNKESEIFIDCLLIRIKKIKLFCLTKHDSLIVRRNDYPRVLDILKEEFAKISLEYSLKVTNLYGNNETHKISWEEINRIE
ncbi:hypothetical protein [Flavobacterium sp.]|uniref:hypothetical protein n=1 Tax=Flavobacterium sp. TaxID=239 RepID=UPI003BD73B2A